jgi:glycosyltransferase involved in cell wall biosynthesis
MTSADLPGGPSRSAVPDGAQVQTPVILVLATNPWDGPWMNRQQLFSRVGLRYPVVYSTGVPQPGRRKSPAGGLSGRLLFKDNVHVDCPPDWLVRPGRPQWLRGLSDRLAAARWRKVAAGLGDGPLTAYVLHPKFWPLLRHLRPARIVYHAYDLYHLQGSPPYPYAEEERHLIRSADLVIASSEPIADYLRTIGATRVELLENAADYEAFSSAGIANGPEPQDMAAIGRPRIGYTGALNRKVDFPLIVRLARRFPGWQFVLVGRVGQLDAVCEPAVEELRDLANVHFLGFKRPQDLPRYVAAMDVNVMWYRVGAELWTAGGYPLKLHEYLASGRPVVSADLLTVRPFQDVLRIAVTPEDWESALTESLGGRDLGTVAKRRARAQENTWGARVSRLDQLLRGVL